MELLNSKVNHPDYMCDHSDVGRRARARPSARERFKLLYDIYHMQIMEGDVIAHDPEAPRILRPLPHRRRPGPPRDRRDAGALLPGDHAGDRRDRLQGVCGPGIHPPVHKDIIASLAQAVQICDV